MAMYVLQHPSLPDVRVSGDDERVILRYALQGYRSAALERLGAPPRLAALHTYRSATRPSCRRAARQRRRSRRSAASRCVRLRRARSLPRRDGAA